MTNYHDRSFVLDMIYDKMDEINTFMEYANRDDVTARKYAPEAQKMLDTLENYRNQVLARRSFAKRYRVFVESPAGYEG